MRVAPGSAWLKRQQTCAGHAQQPCSPVTSSSATAGRHHGAVTTLRRSRCSPALHLSRRQIPAPAATADRDGTGDSSDGGGSFRDQVAKLQALYYKPSASPAAGERKQQEQQAEALSDSIGAGADAAVSDAGLLRDLPLWRVQWATLPGLQEVLHVHVPHYTHMFEGIMAGPRPWRFGHVYLPGGSAALGTPAAAILPASRATGLADDPFEAAAAVAMASAPSVGVLMELVAAVRCPDGRLIVLAYGVGRMKVERVVQEVPFSRADCRLFPDAEELSASEGLTERVLEAAPADLPLMSAMAATKAAGSAAAVAASQVWQRWETAAVLARGAGVRDASRDPAGLAALRRLEEADTVVPVAAPARAPSGQGFGGVQVEAAEAAHAAAGRAAAAAWSQGGSSPVAADVVWDAARQARGTTAERGIASRGASEEVEAETEAGIAAREADGNDAEAPVLGAEAGVWAELDGVVTSAAALRLKQLQLPPGLLSLRPSPDAAQSSFGAGGEGDAAKERPPGSVAATAAAPQSDSPGAFGSDAPSPFSTDLLPGGIPGDFSGISSGSGAAAAEAEEAAETARQDSPASSSADSTVADVGGKDGNSGSSSGGGSVGFCPPEYPALRRAQRLSYAMPIILQDISTSEGRQGLLEARGVAARLGLIRTALRKHRKILAALASLKGLGD